MINKILCALDGSTHADKALNFAIEIAKRFDAKLILFHVLLRNLDPEDIRRFTQIEGMSKEAVAEVKRLQNVDSRIEVGHPYDVKGIPSNMLVELGNQILGSASAEAKEAGVSDVIAMMADGDPAARILACAKQENVDCIAMGCRGLSDMQAFLEGSVSRKVSNRATCTTIAVR